MTTRDNVGTETGICINRYTDKMEASVRDVIRCHEGLLSKQFCRRGGRSLYWT